MLALGGQETARRAFLRIQISLEPGSVFGRGRNSRSTLVPSESKFGDPNGRSGTADRSVHTAVFGAGDLSAVALDQASIEIICGSTMSRRAESAAMMQIGRATAVQPKVI